MKMSELVSEIEHKIGTTPDVQYRNGAVWSEGDKSLSLYVLEGGDVLVDQYVSGKGHQNTVAAGPELILECVRWVTDGRN